MNLIFVLVVLMAFVVIVAWLVATVAADGRGLRPAPRSHLDDQLVR